MPKVFSYDQNFVPALPIATIEIMHPHNTERTVEVNAVIDTAADSSCIPVKLIQELALTYTISEVMDFQNRTVNILETYVDMKFADNLIRGLSVFCIDDDSALIGRDILNNYKIVFDGPNQRWSIE